MKKFRLFLTLGFIAMCIFMPKIPAFAKSGDIIGKIYSTDIIAKIDGLNAPSYNIGGKTAIIIEELDDPTSSRTYAINAKYDDTLRRLDVAMSSSQGFYGEEYNEIKRGTPGKVVGDVYETDIKVYFNGYEVEGMNIGGRTAVALEDLGQIGGINEEFGISKYRCKATWNADERIISLDFIDERNSFSTFDYGTFLRYTLNDNVLTATFDRMAYAHSEREEDVFSEEFQKEVNVLKPLFLDDGKEKTKIGFMYIEDNSVDDYVITRLYVTETELMKELTANIHDGKTPSPEEAFKLLDNKEDYETLDIIETEDFYLATVKLLKVEGFWNDIAYVLITKTGGFGKIYSGSTYYKEREITKTGENIIEIGEGPTADPHGKPVMMYGELNLNNYFVK